MENQLFWDKIIDFPLEGRSEKPRKSGLTMVIDKGMGLAAVKDWLTLNAPFVDYMKFSFGTSALYPEDVLCEKITCIRNSGIEVYPGGTFLEIALWRGKLDEYLLRSLDLGYSCIEVSDGTLDIEASTRRGIIEKARGMGFSVITEVGQKDARDSKPLSALLEQIGEDLRAGASKVIVEARESGKGVVIFDGEGKLRRDEMEQLTAAAPEGSLIWEAPDKKQQHQLIERFGPDVNLGNIPPDEVVALESLRRGLRGDTFRSAIQRKKERV
ncbi:MAG: phosphosulfolactate synthase [Christensenellales bacterium]|jgi:phosphosulfolactate synthase